MFGSFSLSYKAMHERARFHVDDDACYCMIFCVYLVHCIVVVLLR